MHRGKAPWGAHLKSTVTEHANDTQENHRGENSSGYNHSSRCHPTGSPSTSDDRTHTHWPSDPRAKRPLQVPGFWVRCHNVRKMALQNHKNPPQIQHMKWLETDKCLWLSLTSAADLIKSRTDEIQSCCLRERERERHTPGPLCLSLSSAVEHYIWTFIRRKFAG